MRTDPIVDPPGGRSFSNELFALRDDVVNDIIGLMFVTEPPTYTIEDLPRVSLQGHAIDYRRGLIDAIRKRYPDAKEREQLKRDAARTAPVGLDEL